MKTLFALVCLVTALFLTSVAGFGAQTFVAFGLTNITLGEAVAGPNPYLQPAFNNLGPNGDDGVSILLGEADSAVFVYPLTDNDPRTGSFMEGRLYGSVNGETNRLICMMRCHEQADGEHPVAVDFTPLGATALTYFIFRGRQLLAQTGPHPGGMVVHGTYFDPYFPRVNPFWRLRDGSIGALIEFTTPHNRMTFPEIGEIVGDRVFVRAENASNTVEFAERLDVTGGGGLEWFAIDDTRLGVFNRPHKAIDETLFLARRQSLTLSTDPTNQPNPGVAIELDVARRFDAGFVPIELGSNSVFSLTAIGVGGFSGETLGSLQITRVADTLDVAANLSVAATNTEAVVYDHGVEVGRALGTSATVTSLTRIVGLTARTLTMDDSPSLGWRFELSVAMTLANQQSYTGNEIRFVGGPPSTFAALEALTLTASNLASFTITSEEEFPIVPPRLSIRRVGMNLELSWSDPSQIFHLEQSDQLEYGFYPSSLVPIYEGTTTRVIVEEQQFQSMKFYRLTTSLDYGYEE